MKVIQLQSNNVMRLQAVDITPEGNLVVVGGKNGAGKSSVLNSIAMALGGKDLAPVEPIRNGEAEASIKLDLGDLVVVRKFWRDRLPCDCGVSPSDAMPIVGDDDMHTKTCASKTKFGETESSLLVTNKDGAKYPSPQAMLNKLLSNLTFDPLAFKELDPKPQDELLRRLMKIDTTAIDEKRKAAYEERTIQHKTRDIKMAQLIKLPKHDDIAKTAEEVSIDAIAESMKLAEGLRDKATAARKLAETRNEKVTGIRGEVEQRKKDIAQLERQLSIEKEQLEKREQEILLLDAQYQDLAQAADKAEKETPDTSELRAKLTQANQINTKIRENKAYDAASKEIIDVENRIEELNYAIQHADDEKRTLLESAKFPVPGLGLSDNGVTFNGVPYSQASGSEQLRVSVAIGLALNTGLKVLLIRSGNLLDDDSLKLVAEQAAAADAQVWMEYVTRNEGDADRVSVMIEDGHVRT